MRDRDGDDYGDQTATGSVTPGTDCDDISATAADTYPGAAAIDGPVNCMKDSDGDDYGDMSVVLPIVPGGDCADDDAARNPGATEVCDDGVDSDCDGADPVCPVTTVELSLDDPNSLTWASGDPGATYSVYRGDVDTLRSTGIYTQEPGAAPQAERFCGVSQTSLAEPYQPESGGVVFYLVAPRSGPGDASLGTDSRGGQRPNAHPCDG
jgi:hypothetical protein